jgi:hypothetical protein
VASIIGVLPIVSSTFRKGMVMSPLQEGGVALTKRVVL